MIITHNFWYKKDIYEKAGWGKLIAILDGLLVSALITTFTIIWVIIKYDPFLMLDRKPDVLSIESMSTWMEQSGYIVVHPDTSKLKIADDGIVIYKTSYAQAEYFEFEDSKAAQSCYIMLINNISDKYEDNESLQVDVEDKYTGIKVDNAYYYLKVKGNHLLYIWTQKGFVDSVNELISDIPF